MKKLKYTVYCFVITLFACWVSACSTHGANPNDPYEEYNRHADKFNEKLDAVIFKPVAIAYKKVLPWPAVQGISNFYSNLYQIPTIINDLLQAKFYYTVSDSWRFFINSTLGLAGFIDVADKMGLHKHYQDFGLTLAQWGYRRSNYLVMPIIGPRTFRDSIAWGMDYCVFSVYLFIPNPAWAWGLSVGAFVDARGKLLDFDDTLKQVAIDPYVLRRNAYQQRRAYLIEQNALPPDISYGLQPE